MTGPCFSAGIEKITCLFTDKDGDVTSFTDHRGTVTKRIINGIVVNGRAVCPMPLFRALGDHNVTITFSNGTSYTGYFSVGMYIYLSFFSQACAGLIGDTYVHMYLISVIF